MSDGPQRQAAHLRAWNDIPWLVAGSADEEQVRAVRAHLLECADCREEFAFQQQLHAALQDDALPPHDPEPALRRLQARIDIADGLDAGAAQTAAARRGWTRTLVAAGVLQAFGLVVLGAALLARNEGGYRTLSSRTPPAVATIRLVPAPQMSVADLRALLGRHRLRAVEISADAVSLGVVPWADDADKADGAPPLLRALRAEPGVLLAEPVAGGR